MKKPVLVAAIVGLFVPLFWGVLAFLLFSAKESVWTELFWTAVYVTCPFWLLPGGLGAIVMPFANAALYATICFLVVVSLRKLVNAKD